MTQPLDLDQIEARADAATEGPWCTDSWEIYQGTEYQPGISQWIGETCRGTGSPEQDRADAAFVAAARTDVPAMAAEIRRLRADAAAELLPAWEAVYEPGNVSNYLIGYTNDECAAKAAAEAWLRSQADVTGRLEWEHDDRLAVERYDRWFELVEHHDDSIPTGPGLIVRRRAAAEETHVVADDTIWLERRPCGCIVAAVVAIVPGTWTLTTAEDAALHFHDTEGERRRAAAAGLTVEPVTGAQYREQFRDRWHCGRHTAAGSAAARP